VLVVQIIQPQIIYLGNAHNMHKKELEIDFSSIIAEKKKGKAPLNKPFRLPSGSKKKFGVYVKNDKGNIVMVKFGDPNMSIKRDNPERRKAYRSRHGCDNPGPKYKANYWSCKMWSAKPVSKITGSEEEITLEAEVQAKGKGLWYNIQQKKKRMGKNYRPAPKGSKDRPSQEALKKAQGSDYENEAYEWDGETEFDQIELLKIDQNLAQVEEVEEAEIKASTMFEVGDKVKNINPSCKHYGSEGVVKEILDLGIRVEGQSQGILEDIGYAVVYECTNEGMTWKKGDLLGKTEIQLERIEAKYENDEEYKNMMTTEEKKFNDFLKQCIPTKQGDDKAKFKSCLQDYKNKK